MLPPVDDRLLAVEVDESLKGQGVSGHIPGQVLEGLRIIRRYRLSDVRGKARMPPSQKLRGQPLRDGVFLDEPRQLRPVTHRQRRRHDAP